MERLGTSARTESRVYLTGGATAVLHEWRPQTVDIDLSLEPEQDAVLRAIPRLKEALHVNVELATPAPFIPELPGWRDRSAFEATHGRLHFYHYDFYAQALSKIHRSLPKDLEDVSAMLDRSLTERVFACSHA